MTCLNLLLTGGISSEWRLGRDDADVASPRATAETPSWSSMHSWWRMRWRLPNDELFCRNPCPHISSTNTPTNVGGQVRNNADSFALFEQSSTRHLSTTSRALVCFSTGLIVWYQSSYHDVSELLSLWMCLRCSWGLQITQQGETWRGTLATCEVRYMHPFNLWGTNTLSQPFLVFLDSIV